MPELRHDPIQKRWVIIAPERSRPPDEFPRHPDHAGELCPFCEGSESKTPSEILALRPHGGPPNGPGWQVRVVPNKFPALRVEGELERKGIGVYDRMNGVGAHEVIVETPQHDLHVADMPVAQIGRILWAYRERLVDLMRDRRLKYVLIFKNHGIAAGASLAHPHTQVIATPVIPLTVDVELESAEDHYLRKERCLFCDVVAQELDSGERIVASTDRFVALAPYASRFPFELFLAPRRHHHSFAEIADDAIPHLAQILKDVLLRMKRGLSDPPYNLVVHTVPNEPWPGQRATRSETSEADYHWHIELMPRLSRNAGFEWGTGYHINPTPPEQAARYLRELEM